LHGFGYGFGLMTFLNENIFAKVEVEIVDYRKTNLQYTGGSDSGRYRLNTTSGIFSLGYRF
jgi:opacity protein-like surface antigen